MKMIFLQSYKKKPEKSGFLTGNLQLQMVMLPVYQTADSSV